MSCTMKVLLHLGEGKIHTLSFYDAETCTDLVRVIHAWISNAVSAAHVPGIIYIDDEWMPDLGPDSTDFVIGAQRPDDIKKVAQDWNAPLLGRTVEALQQLEDSAEASGLAKLSEYAATGKNALPNEAQYAGTWDKLADAIAICENKFVYGCDSLVLWDGYWTIVSDWMLANINEHPEQWLMLKVNYD